MPDYTRGLCFGNQSEATGTVVRTPTRDELSQAARVAQLAFGSEDIDDWIDSYNWVADNFGIDYTTVVEAGGKIVSSMLCTPGYARFANDILPLSAVGAVATLPDHRQHGYAGLMMSESVRILHRKGYHTAALWPFSYAYYRKFGWELASEGRIYMIPSEIAAQLWKPDGTRPALRDDLPAISKLIDRSAVNYNCVTIRDELWWSFISMIRRFKFDGNEDLKCCMNPCPWVHETDGVIDGYVMFKIVGEGDQTHVAIDELVADSPKSRQALLSRLASSGLSNIALFTTADDGFLQELPNPRAVKTSVHAGFQFRVINPLAALELRRLNPDVSGLIGFNITDPVLGEAKIDVEISKGVVSRANEQALQRLSMDVQAFSQIFSGYIRPMRAAELGLVNSTSEESLRFAERLFPKILPCRSLVEIG